VHGLFKLKVDSIQDQSTTVCQLRTDEKLKYISELHKKVVFVSFKNLYIFMNFNLISYFLQAIFMKFGNKYGIVCEIDWLWFENKEQ
jgi:hypothetical protein